MSDVNQLKDVEAGLERVLGFHPLLGGRRLGELKCSHLTAEGQVYLEMPGSWVSIAQVQAIRTILMEGR